MKQITISIFCLSLFTLSALAQDTPAADNTSKNQRDRSGETRTSGDQSNSPEDVQITATYSSRRRQGSFTLCDRQEREDYYRRWSCHIARARAERGGENKNRGAGPIGGRQRKDR